MNLPSRELPVATILLVEDEPALRALVGETLEDCGYRVISAENAADARGHWNGSAGDIDLLVTDVLMPGGDGAALAEELRAGRGALKVLFMSGDPGGALARGVPYLQKPFTTEDLLARVRQVLSEA